MHIKDERVFRLMPIIEPLLEQVDALALEYDLGTHYEDFSLNHPLMAPKPLSQVLDEEKYLKLKKIIQKSFGVNVDEVEHLQPFLVVHLITQTLLHQDREVELDLFLWQRAQALGLPIIGLEDVRDHLRVVDKLPYDRQLKMLLDLGKNPARVRRHIKHIVSLYERGEIYKLHKTLRRQAMGMRRTLVFDRNVVMANRILEHCREKRLFVAVGVGHLAGGKGIIRLLKKQGLKLKQVPMPPLLNG